MALLRLDGNDHYDTSYFPNKWTTVSSTAVTWSVTADGPDGKNCIQREMTSSGGSGMYLGAAGLMTQSGPWTPTVSGVCGFKVWVNAMSNIAPPLGAGNPSNALITIMSGSNYHLALQLNTDGTFTLVRAGFSGTTLATSAEGLRDSEWATVEMKWGIDNANGAAVVVVNRVAVLTIGGVPTKNAGIVDTTWNSVRIAGSTAASGSSDLVMRICDFYIADLTGGAEDIKDFLLSWNFATIVSDGIGDTDDWTPSAGDNWENVDEIPPDGDTTYNKTTTLTNRDSFTFEDVPANAVILGFQIVALPRLTAAGVAGITPSIRIAATDYDGIEQGVTQTTYSAFRMWPYDTSPATAVKATEAEINAAEFGYIKSA